MNYIIPFRVACLCGSMAGLCLAYLSSTVNLKRLPNNGDRKETAIVDIYA